jgi:hypothetical protein
VAPTTTDAPTPTPTSTSAPEPLIFKLTFQSDAQARDFAAELASRYGIPVSDIDILAADNATVTFKFLGSSAGALSQRFNDTPEATLLVQYGITDRQASPANEGGDDGDDDDSTRLILFIVIPIVGVVLIVAVVLIVRHKVSGGGNGRVGFQEYVSIQQQQRDDRGGVANGVTPQRRSAHAAGGDDEMSRML